MLAFITSLALAAAPAARVENLSWLSGTWLMRVGQQWTEERWAPARGGMMLGTALSGRGGMAGSFEYMRIAAGQDGALTLWASPDGKEAVPFTLVSVRGAEAIFENPAHDFPTRIVYRRKGRILETEVSKRGNSSVRTWFERQR